MTAVAVAVVSFETRALLERCLRSLEPEHRAGRAEVWVVDNASSDGSAAMVSERFGWVRLHASDRNLGFGAAVNLVAGATSTEWIAPTNADVELTDGALATLLRVGADEQGVGAVAPRLRLPDGRTQHSVHHFPTVPFTAAFNLGLRRVVPGLGDRLCIEGSWDPERPRVVDWALGAFLVVRRCAWEQSGGFDPGQWMYAEDLDLGWRLRDAGWQTRYEPSAVVEHESSASTSVAFGSDLTARWVRSTYEWMRLRRGPLRTRVAAAINIAGASVRWLALRPLSIVRPGRFDARLRALRFWARVHRVGLRGAAGAENLSGPA